MEMGEKLKERERRYGGKILGTFRGEDKDYERAKEHGHMRKRYDIADLFRASDMRTNGYWLRCDSYNIRCSSRFILVILSFLLMRITEGQTNEFDGMYINRSLKIRPLFEILQEGVASNAMKSRTTALQAAAAAPAESSGSVSFPNDYPNSVKHFLLIGSLGMFLGACVFLYLSVTRAKSSLAHTLVFLTAAIASMAYYAMWTGIGVELKTTDLSPRVIFLSRYVDALLTQPVRSSDFAFGTFK
eukprot:768137-Hanusia_phi.AAC.3